MKLFILTAIITMAMFAQGSAPQPEPHGNCCLCMCHAKDETKCSRMCVRLQHSKRIIELPEMNVCTKECARVHVIQTK
jgi:hypothetical protein